MHKWIHQIEEVRQAIFVGFFGPIGVSAVFYLFVSLEFIEEHLSDTNGVPRSDVENLAETIRVVVWFLAVCSIVAYGLSIPLGKLGYLAPPTIGRVLSKSLSDEPRTIEAHQRIPVIGKYLIRESGDGESKRTSTTLISGPSNPRHPHSTTVLSGDPLSAAVASSAASHLEVESGTVTPVRVRRERKIRTPTRFHQQGSSRPPRPTTSSLFRSPA
ncbi:hypothetical protein TOPH_04715 [Tolypocladium ophioglossoides CBS 100239]|uniref:Uncharacterized protein n=1 Tax=Tolypocladium ophioglossoides (strain CBS 100239) TaxID=1163406 RepID=A0A0L0NA48_TOLOC|nr:hypothetical protein TOPH_04715 [Tolypocladium ophioglossoides CBS 100239]